MANDDDILTGPVPAPDAEPSAAERAQAKTFADLVDKTLAGRTPPAMPADARALLEVATVIRAATGKAELAREKQRSLVEDVLRNAVGASAPAAGGGITPISAARQRRWLPWTIAGASSIAAVAAIAMLWLRGPRVVEVPVTIQEAEVPMTWRSRPADALVGPIDRAQAGNAVSRIDAIFENRLHGYRERRLAGVTSAARGGK